MIKQLRNIAIGLFLFYLLLKVSSLLIPDQWLENKPNQASLLITDRYEKSLWELPAGYRSEKISLNDLPREFIPLLILTEDQRFYWHRGIDSLAIGRAVINNYLSGKVLSDGSTITQQLARSYFVEDPNYRYQKLKEVILSVILELKYSKNQILQKYLQRSYFGYQTRGLALAARIYFNKPLNSLNLSEQVVLIVILRSPDYFDPYLRAPEILRFSRQILQRARVKRLIPEGEIARALQIEPKYSKQRLTRLAPHFTNYIKVNNLHKGQNKLITTLDLQLQKDAEKIIRQVLRKTRRKKIENASCLVVDVHSAEVLAYIGSQDYFEPKYGQLDGVQIFRQAGAMLKPFLYAQAFSSGYSPATFLPDLPLTFGSNNGYYKPDKYSRGYFGLVTARVALANALNLPALYLASRLNLLEKQSLMHRCELEALRKDFGHYGAGIALGYNEVSLWQMAQAYLIFARGGTKSPLRVLKQQDQKESSEIMDTRIAFFINDILSDSQARNNAVNYISSKKQTFARAIMSGTSIEGKDHWCIEYTPDYLVAVWLGNLADLGMNSFSVEQDAEDICHRILSKVVGQKKSSFVLPAGIVKRLICLKTGLRAGAFCEKNSEEYLLEENNSQLEYCQRQLHRPAPENSISELDTNQKVKITHPRQGSYLAYDLRISPERQMLFLEYQSAVRPQRVQWIVNGHKLSGNKWPLQRGLHEVQLRIYRSGKWYTDQARFTVL